jgi:hypothetical protein
MRRHAVTVLALLALTACNGGDPPTVSPSGEPTQSPSVAPNETAGGTTAPTQATCGPEKTIPIQGEGHLVGNQKPPVPYNSVPPTSGWHASGDVPIDVAPPNKPLTEPEQVTVLELGGVVVSYAELADEDLKAVTALVKGKLAGFAALTRYDKLEAGEIALTGWGVLQRCDGLDKAAITAFAKKHAG